MSRGQRLLLGAIVAVGAILRAEGIGAHLSDAEGYSYLVGAAPTAGAFLHRLAAYENTPPLFYLLLAPLPLGAGAAWLRVPAALPGALIPLALFAAIRRPLGTRAALLAAGLTAAAPFAVSYSDYSRGFMLEALACIVALHAMLRLAEGGSPRWWWLYATAALVALYTEYLAIIFLAALTLAAVARTRRPRLALGLVPIAALAPWIGQFERGQDALHHTKISPTFPGPSLASLRDVAVRLTVGEHGAAGSAGGRWLEFAAIVAVVIAAVVALRHTQLNAVATLAATAVLTLAASALAPAFGIEIFNERYLVVLIPLAAALLAAAVAELNARVGWTVAAALTAAIAVAVFAQRLGREYEPSLAPVRTAVQALHPGSVLTNSAVVAYYLRGLPVSVDRPFGLGPGRPCTRPRCVIVDDARVPGIVRVTPLATRAIGPFEVSLMG